MSPNRSPVSKACTVMVTVTTVLKAVGLFVAELISSFTDWFQTKPTWANLEVLENTELKTTGGGELKLEDCSLSNTPYSFTSNYISPFQSMRGTKQKLFGRRLVLWSWLYGDLDDYCAERWAMTTDKRTHSESVTFAVLLRLSDSSATRRLLSFPL